MFKNISIYKYILSIVLVLSIIKSFDYYKESKRLEEKKIIKSKLSSMILKKNVFPDSIHNKNNTYSIKYTFNNQLDVFIRKILKRYRSDYSAVVVMDNKDGKILAMVAYDKENDSFDNRLIFSNTNPAASIFKIITTSELLNTKDIGPNDYFSYRGKGSTLYKYQLVDKQSSWNRNITLRKAFAFSNNVIFGKAAINNLTASGLFDMAVKFGFNKNIISDINIPSSVFPMAISQYNLAELASGFNTQVLISPIHSVIFPSIVANGGQLIYPTFISSVERDSDNELISINSNRNSNIVFDYNLSLNIRDMMEAVTKIGTAKIDYGQLPSNYKRRLYIGGKTGSITGGNPYGQRDWFVTYALPKNGNKKGISISVMNINKEKWYVRSSKVAMDIIKYYYNNIEPMDVEISSL